MPSIQDVARVAGVSVTTVSLVLNNKGNISPQTRAHVLKVVADLGYTRSVTARNLRDNTARIVGYAWDRDRGGFNPVLDNFLYELVRLTEEDGRHLLLFTAEADSLDVYRELIDSKRVDGFILSHTNQGDRRFAALHEMKVPFVSFGRSLSPMDEIAHWVDIDGQAGTFRATTHLAEQGHQRIAMIGWPKGSASGDARMQGYLDGLRTCGLPPDEALVVRGLNDTGEGYRCGQALMALPDPPTAVVAVSDIIAIGAMRCFSEQDQQIAITGFDDTPLAEHTLPTLTSVRQPVRQVAEILIDMLKAQLNDEPVEVKHHLLDPELIVRASSLNGHRA